LENIKAFLILENPKGFFDEIEVVFFTNPYISKQWFGIDAIRSLVKKHYGFLPSVSIGLGGSDLRFFKNSYGLEFGVNGIDHHTNKEMVEKEDLWKTYIVFKEFLLISESKSQKL